MKTTVTSRGFLFGYFQSMICKFVKYTYPFSYEYGPHQGADMEIKAYSYEEACIQLKHNLRDIWHRVGWHNVTIAPGYVTIDTTLIMEKKHEI